MNEGAFVSSAEAGGVGLNNPIFDNYVANSANSTTVSLNKAASGANRLAIIELDTSDSLSALSITYGGVACTLINSQNVTSTYFHYLFYFLNPPTALTAVVASWTGTARVQMIVRTYYNVNQSTPLGTSAKATDNSTTPSVTVSSAVGELVCDALVSGYSPTPNGGQTSEYSYSIYIGDYGSDRNGATPTVLMSWTQSIGWWGIIGVSIKPV
jgi:hypothetical protein